MKNQAKLFETISQEAIMAIAVFDPVGGRCVFINRLAREWLELGFEGEEDIPLTLDDLVYKDEVGDPRLARPLSREMLGAEGLFQDVIVQKTTGQRFIANVGLRRLSFEDGSERLLVMFQDISIQKKLQREIQAKQEEIRKAYVELLEQNRQLKELDQAKDKFIALTTHELRTPLSAIVATAEVLKLKLHETPDQQDEFIQAIYEQGLHLMELVNDILDFAKIRAGKMEFFVEQADVLEIIRKCLGNFEHMASQQNVTLNLETPATPLLAWVDILRFKEVVSNVINNAIKFNREGGRVDIAFTVDEESLRIAVADTGRGIPAAKLHHVFNEFETVENVARHHKGTGLGMPISKRYMMSMGGNLSLESTENVGTVFYIDIPTTKVLDESMYGSRGDVWADLAS